MNDLVFIDCETSGLYPHLGYEIIEICCIRIDKQGKEQRLYRKARMENDQYDSKALEINGYDPKEWSSAISQRQLALDLAGLCSGCIPVGHNILFDVSFIEELWQRQSIDAAFDRRRLDTMILAYEHLVPLGLDSLSLSRIRSFLGWSRNGEHTAIKDCEDAMSLWFYLLRMSRLRSFWLRFVLWSRRFWGLAPKRAE